MLADPLGGVPPWALTRFASIPLSAEDASALREILHRHVVDLVGPGAAHRGLEHLLQRGRRGVVDDQEPRHAR